MSSKVNLVVEQGSTFNVVFTVNDDAGVPLNLNGYTGRSQMRKHYSSSANTQFSVNVASNGAVTLSLTANTTTAIEHGRYVYDVELVDPDGVVSRIVEGIVTVTPEVTR